MTNLDYLGRLDRERLTNLAHRLEGVELTTIGGRELFSVVVRSGNLYFTPRASKKERGERADRLDDVLRRFREIRSFHPKDYQDLTRNSSYILELIKLCLGQADLQRR